MKLTVLGGAGVRLPLLIRGLIRYQAVCPFTEVSLYDVDEERLALMGALARFLLDEAHSPLTLQWTTNFDEAVTGADFVFSAIRVGQNASRLVDEQVALAQGVVGQETTGPGGFAMALRTIPAMLDYARQLWRTAPDAWLLNFTNPAGIVTQALIEAGWRQTIGICDSPEGIIKRVARYLAVPPDAVSLTYVGLNHLGWVTDVTVGGHSRLAYLLDHYQDMSRDDAEFAAFDADLVRSLGMLPNEYLYYYYYAADAVKNLRQAGETRGEQVAALSQRLFQRLGEAARQNDWQAAWTAYASIMGTRSQTYMQRDMHGTQANRSDRPAVVQEDAGYAGVAIRVASGMASGWSRPVIVNVANRQAVADLEPTDVVEISAVLGADGAHPLAFGALPPKIRGLMLQVKEYERLTIQAAVQGDRQLAVEALAANPLVPSYTVARQMVEQYLKELKPWLPQFA